MIWQQLTAAIAMKHAAQMNGMLDEVLEQNNNEFTKDQITGAFGNSHEAWLFSPGDDKDEFTAMVVTTLVEATTGKTMVVVGTAGVEDWEQAVMGINAVAREFYKAQFIESKGSCWLEHGFTEKHVVVRRAVEAEPEKEDGVPPEHKEQSQ